MARWKQTLVSASNKGKGRIGKRLVAIKKNVNNLNKLKPSQGSVSGALARHIRKWTRQLPAEKLEFFALHLPTDTWRQLADVCHFNPSRVKIDKKVDPLGFEPTLGSTP